MELTRYDIAEERLSGPAIKLLIDELLQLKIMRDKVDHPRKGSKDLADAVCGAIFNSISRTKQTITSEIEVHSYDYSGYRSEIEEARDGTMNLIRAPKMPNDLRDAMDRMMVI